MSTPDERNLRPQGGLLIANRGEVAIRIVRAAAAVGMRTCAIFSEDDEASLHTRRADAARRLTGRGPAAYLDGDQIVEIAKATRCCAVHPGYGFLSEDASFAQRCADEGIVFVGPQPDVLALFGDKAAARRLARAQGVPVPAGTDAPTSLEEAHAFVASLGGRVPVMIKALAGGGGRGMRIVKEPAEVAQAYERCRSEAKSAFGRDDVYVERLIERARHVEVQVVGDGSGAAIALGDRDCSLQRNHQKLVEIAPAFGLDERLRERLSAAALDLARTVCLRGLCTFEFLVGPAAAPSDDGFVFIEANPRLQVEHTVTEAVTGIDLVATQLRLARGESLADVGLDDECRASLQGSAVEVRVNTETILADGTLRPTGGVLVAFDPPSGPGIRVDTFGYAGYRTNPAYDSLLAKVIAQCGSPVFGDAVDRAYEALCEFRIEGFAVNIPFLQNLLRHPDLRAGRIYTTFVEEHLEELADPAAAPSHARRFFEARPEQAGFAGARVDRTDPLAVLAHGASASMAEDRVLSDGAVALPAPVQGTVISVSAAAGDAVAAGALIVVIEAMKMEHEVVARCSGIVREVVVAEGDAVHAGASVAFIDETDVEEGVVDDTEDADPGAVRPDLAEVLRRHDLTRDSARPDAVAKRQDQARRTARENVEDLADAGSFLEYGALTIAAQRARRPLEELIERTPADGLIAGLAGVNGDLFPGDAARCVVLAYDYTVLAGTQGTQSHRKTDRMLAIAERLRLPVVVFTEGGGGRPGDSDRTTPYGLENMTFVAFARLSGLVPRIGISAGRCFAGNAAILGCCDVIIATEGSSIGMAGPAAIEGGGLGVFHPEEIGPMSVQVPNGVVDLAVKDEVEGVREAKRCLSYFQGAVDGWEHADQRLLRSMVPTKRMRIYDMRRVIAGLADTGSVLELRRGFGAGMITALVRVEGRPLGIVANNPAHVGGAIDSDGADKATRFLQLCEAHGLPVLFLCDTPGIMVGPEAERTAIVRHSSRLFVAGASLTVPFFTIVLRKAYGLGANAMTGGSFHAPVFTVAWPTGEFGGMNVEGAVKLGHRRELAAIDDPQERRAAFEQMVAAEYEKGRALSAASYFEIDDVIDPAESRRVLAGAMRSTTRQEGVADAPRRPVDTW